MEIIRLGSHCRVQGGFAFKSNEIVPNGIPIIKIGNLMNGSIDVNYDTCYSNEFLSKKDAGNFIINKGDLLFAMSGATVGKVAINNNEEKLLLNQRVGNLICDAELDEKYLYYVLSSNNMQHQILKKATGCAQPNISGNQIEDLFIPFCNLEEQRKIVEELDSINNLIENRNKQLEDFNILIDSLYKKSIDNEAVEEKKLQDIGDSLIGLTYSPKDITNDGSGIIVLRSSNIQKGELDFNDVVRVNCEIKDSKMVKENDILICSRNGSKELVGKSTILCNLKEKMSFGAFMAIFRSKYNKYLISFFHSNLFRNQLTSSGTATINQITSNMLNNIVVKMPKNEKIIDNVISKIEIIEKEKVGIKEDLEELYKMFKERLSFYFDKEM